MPFREDQDALLARADALEVDLDAARSQAAELRDEKQALAREVAELREATKPAAAPADDTAHAKEELAALADAAGPATQAAAERRERAAAKRAGRRKAARAHGDKLDDRLAAMTDDTLVSSLLLIGVPIAVAAAALIREAWAIAPAMAVGFVAGVVASRLRARWRVGWVRSIPFALDRNSFASRIHDERKDDPVRVRVRFADRVPDKGRALIARAVSGAWGEAAGTWDVDELIVQTSPIESGKTVTSQMIPSYRIFVPGRYLRACRRVVVDCLMKIHAAYPIAEITFLDPRERRR